MTVNVFLQNHFVLLSKNYDIYLVANFSTFAFKNIPSIKETFNLKIDRKINIFNDFITTYKLINYLRINKFDAVHTITPKAGLIGMIASFICNTQFRIHIFTGQVWHTKKGFYKYFLMLFDRLIVRLSTNILVDGNSQRKFLISNKIVAEEKSMVLGPGSISGVDIYKFSPDKSKKQMLRVELGLDQDNVVFSFLGRLNFEKGIIDLVHSFIELSEQYKNISLVVIGVDEDNLISFINDKFDVSNIVFVKECDKPEDYLQVSDIFCLPSYREGFGTSILEASSLELPIIASDTYGLLDTVLVNETGLRHKSGSIEDLKSKMEFLLLNKSIRESFGKNGRQFVLNNFSSDSISLEWLSFYANLLK
jgi:glycosyltransferase involved in cell wall biosynthesis